MPERGYEFLCAEDRQRLKDYVPGYDWVPGSFGPPPGIPRAKKEQLDRMTDRDFMAAVMRMGQEEKESLMVSEAERRRTYKCLWSDGGPVKSYDLASEGFYYTGVSDRVQCAFCGGILQNWERGDIPRQSHLAFFDYCKMAQRKPCPNIPIGTDSGFSDDFRIDLLSTQQDEYSFDSVSLTELGINQSKPTHGRYRFQTSRLETFNHYSNSYPMKPEDLSAAGFYYEGPADKVRCFWCDGALELWSAGDDPWTEHAKWYPGCSFVQQMKGREFVKLSRSTLSNSELDLAETLRYNDSGLDKTGDDEANSEVNHMTYDTYQSCLHMGIQEDVLKRVYAANKYQDFSDIQNVLDAVFALEDGDKARFDSAVSMSKVDESKKMDTDEKVVDRAETPLNVPEFITDPKDVTEDKANKVVTAMTCSQCEVNYIGAVLLPCGHFTLCHECTRKPLPKSCFVCNKPVRAACRAFIN